MGVMLLIPYNTSHDLSLTPLFICSLYHLQRSRLSTSDTNLVDFAVNELNWHSSNSPSQSPSITSVSWAIRLDDPEGQPGVQVTPVSVDDTHLTHMLQSNQYH